jgi:hypothetical protein
MRTELLFALPSFGFLHTHLFLTISLFISFFSDLSRFIIVSPMCNNMLLTSDPGYLYYCHQQLEFSCTSTWLYLISQFGSLSASESKQPNNLDHHFPHGFAASICAEHLARRASSMVEATAVHRRRQVGQARRRGPVRESHN